MSYHMPDFDALAKEVDDIDTQMLVRGRLTMDEIERLEDIVSELEPIFYGGLSEHMAQAMTIHNKISKMLGREEAPPSDIDEVICQMCGARFTGTDEEIKAWQDKHIDEVHPELRPHPYG